MKILVVRGNPRKNGYTSHITNLVVRGARENGAEIDDLDLSKYSIKTCKGCYLCWTLSHGVCVQKDDMADLLERVLAADVVVMSTPLYYYAISAVLKTFIERTFPLFKPGSEETPAGLMKNSVRYPDKWRNKRMLVVVAGAFRDREDFAGIRETFGLMAGGMSMELAGMIIRPESYLLQFELSKPMTSKIIETALVRAGMEVATMGAVTPDTIEKACSPMSVDTRHFRTYSDVYWEHSVALRGEATDLARVQRNVTADVRILMREMARSIDPVAAARLKATLQFDFTDKDLHFTLEVDRGTCALTQGGSADKPHLRVTTTTVVWASVFMRETSMKDALLARSVVLQGDRSIFARLDRYFPPPSS